MSRVCRRWARLTTRLITKPEVWKRVRAAGPLEIAARCAGARAGPCVSSVREWRSKNCVVSFLKLYIVILRIYYFFYYLPNFYGNWLDNKYKMYYYWIFFYLPFISLLPSNAGHRSFPICGANCAINLQGQLKPRGQYMKVLDFVSTFNLGSDGICLIYPYVTLGLKWRGVIFLNVLVSVNFPLLFLYLRRREECLIRQSEESRE